VQNNVRDVVSPGLRTIKLVIRHVGDGGQGVIIRMVYVRKCPDETLPPQALGNGPILENIDVIIKIHEFVMAGLAEDNPHHHSQGGANSEGGPSGGRHRLNGSTIADAGLIPKLLVIVCYEKALLIQLRSYKNLVRQVSIREKVFHNAPPRLLRNFFCAINFPDVESQFAQSAAAPCRRDVEGAGLDPGGRRDGQDARYHLPHCLHD
jgi:hypothetical protein